MKKRRVAGVIYPEIIPANVSGTIPARICFPFRHLNYTFTVDLDRAVYAGAGASKKYASVPAGAGDSWLAGYYAAFAEDTAQSGVYSKVLGGMRRIRSEQNMTPDEYLEMLTAYVQSLPYDAEKLLDEKRVPRFPVETIVEGKGICSDKSLLLAGLLAHEGYAVAVLQFVPEKHLAVGIPVPPGYDYAKTGYAVIETTMIAYVGDCSGEFAPGRKITSRPRVFPIGHGSKRYAGIAEIAHILRVRKIILEKVAPDGPLAGEIRRQEQLISEEKAELAERRRQIQELEAKLQSAGDFRDSDALLSYRSGVDSYNQKVSALAGRIQRHNVRIDEFNRLMREADYIHRNRLDRRSVFARIRNIQV